MPGYRGQILVFFDISDPRNPKEAGRWWMPGQKEGEAPARNDISLHGPAIVSADGTKAYLGYGRSAVILDIRDIRTPKPIGELTISPPFGALAAHDVLAIPGKPLLFVPGETTGGGDQPDGTPAACSSPFTIAVMIEIQNEVRPRLMSVFSTPVLPQSAPYTDFCDKGGRFGPHNRISNTTCRMSRRKETGSI